LLTGGSQLSAGETFTQAMMNRRPQPVRIGANTQGVFSDVLLRTLPNGWQYILPNEEFRTLGWKAFDGPGIPPHLRRPVFTAAELDGGRDSAFTTAVALLGRRR
jgi:C-terminal processing protease CtpA/Prc